MKLTFHYINNALFCTDNQSLMIPNELKCTMFQKKKLISICDIKNDTYICYVMKAQVLHIDKPSKGLLTVFQSLRIEKEAKKSVLKSKKYSSFKKI